MRILWFLIKRSKNNNIFFIFKISMYNKKYHKDKEHIWNKERNAFEDNIWDKQQPLFWLNRLNHEKPRAIRGFRDNPISYITNPVQTNYYDYTNILVKRNNSFLDKPSPQTPDLITQPRIGLIPQKPLPHPLEQNPFILPSDLDKEQDPNIIGNPNK